MSSYGLENDHNVYVLGAGFSAGAGLPVMRDFLDRMRDSIDWLTEQGRNDERKAIESVLEFRLRGASAAYRTALDLENIEELFSLASAAGLLSLTSQMQRAIAATLDFCAKTSTTIDSRTRTVLVGKECPIRPAICQAMQRLVSAFDLGYVDGWEYLDVPDFQTLLGALNGQFSPASEQRKNTFVTFNYDLLVEESLARSGMAIDYGVPFGSLLSKAPWVRPGGIEVLKLHGSVNWTFSDDRTHMVAHKSYAESLNDATPPVLVPPTWRKDFPGQLAMVWDAALGALATATRIVIVGFSMPPTDQHFRYLLAAGLRDNISLRQIIFVDPNMKHVHARTRYVLRPELVDRGVIQFVEAPATALLQKSLLSLINRPLSSDIRITPE